MARAAAPEAQGAFELDDERAPGRALGERFSWPPFSVLNQREGEWMKRKRGWLSLGIQSELGRGVDVGGGRHREAFHGGGKWDTEEFGALSRRRMSAPGNHGRSASGQYSLSGHNAGLREHRQQEQLEKQQRLAEQQGLTIKSVSGRDSNYYRQKQVVEKHLGRKLTNPEFEAEHYIPNVGPQERKELLAGGSRSYRDPAFYEQKRKVESELGRELTTEEFIREHYVNEQVGGGLSETGTSVFDPVLCELTYRWFCPPGGAILDPFAGGSVRGIVAGVLGLSYTGVDLSEAQLEANREQLPAILENLTRSQRERWIEPRWIVGDALDVRDLAGDREYDLFFTCPPYGDLEVYSDDPRDLSRKDPLEFRTAYSTIIESATVLLRSERFAVIVVGEYRAPTPGLYRGLVPWTIFAFEEAGLGFYNESILVTPLGSLPVRGAKQFQRSRKIGKTHQNVLGFVKGEPLRAADACGLIDGLLIGQEVDGDA